ncbi:Fc.00g103090.m01.CDS01 [Cosmosporella sp. VM-42]
MRYSSAAGLAFALVGPNTVRAASGTGHSTRYWDCCKPSCAWSGKASVSAPVLTCDAKDNPLGDFNAPSGCGGGSAFTCTNNSPWIINENLAYGFAATAINGEDESSWCCACYALTFTEQGLNGKTMIVQSTNTGSDISNNQFDILIPGGGMGQFDGCTPEFGSMPGDQYGGVKNRDDCEAMPELLKDGCKWRWDWFNNADNPSFTFEQVQCPKELTDKTGCKRDDDSSFPVFKGASDDSGSNTSKLSTTAAAATTAAPITQSPPFPSSNGTIAVWQQCNGQKSDYPDGAAACDSGNKCVYINDWYSQCQPN